MSGRRCFASCSGARRLSAVTSWSIGEDSPCFQTNNALGPSFPCHCDNRALQTGHLTSSDGRYQSNILMVFLPYNDAVQRERRLSPRSAKTACWVLLGFDFTFGFLDCCLYDFNWQVAVYCSKRKSAACVAEDYFGCN